MVLFVWLYFQEHHETFVVFETALAKKLTTHINLKSMALKHARNKQTTSSNPVLEGKFEGETAVHRSTCSLESVKIMEPCKTELFVISVASCAALGGIKFGYNI